MKKPAVIIASDDTALRRHVSTVLAMRGCDVFDVLNASEILPAARRQRAALIIIGPCGNGTWDSLHVAQQIRRADSTISLILIAAHSSEALVIAALRAGITDYFKPPLGFDELSASVMRCLWHPHPSLPPWRPRGTCVPDGRCQSTDAAGQGLHQPGRHDRQYGSDHWGERHRQRTGRRNDPPQQHSTHQPIHRHQLRGNPGQSARERALRPRERGLHGANGLKEGQFQPAEEVRFFSMKSVT